MSSAFPVSRDASPALPFFVKTRHYLQSITSVTDTKDPNGGIFMGLRLKKSSYPLHVAINEICISPEIVARFKKKIDTFSRFFTHSVNKGVLWDSKDVLFVEWSVMSVWKTLNREISDQNIKRQNAGYRLSHVSFWSWMYMAMIYLYIFINDTALYSY